MAHNGTDAVRLVKTETVQLLLADVVMPEMSGPQVASALTLLNPGLRVQFMPGHTDKGIVRGAALEADVRLLAKPFAADGLLGAVQAVGLPAGSADATPMIVRSRIFDDGTSRRLQARRGT